VDTLIIERPSKPSTIAGARVDGDDEGTERERLNRRNIGLFLSAPAAPGRPGGFGGDDGRNLGTVAVPGNCPDPGRPVRGHLLLPWIPGVLAFVFDRPFAPHERAATIPPHRCRVTPPPSPADGLRSRRCAS
jgi:hypothetical protein